MNDKTFKQYFICGEIPADETLYEASDKLASIVEGKYPEVDFGILSNEGKPSTAQAACLGEMGLSGHNLDEVPDYWLKTIFLAAKKLAGLVGNNFATGSIDLSKVKLKSK